jgi:hypothetical protein
MAFPHAGADRPPLLVELRHAVFIEDGGDFGAVGVDQLVDALPEFLVAVAHRHRDLEIELHARP